MHTIAISLFKVIFGKIQGSARQEYNVTRTPGRPLATCQCTSSFSPVLSLGRKTEEGKKLSRGSKAVGEWGLY